MGKHSLEALWTQYETAKQSKDLAALAALADRVPADPECGADLLNCIGITIVILAKSTEEVFPGFSRLRSARRLAGVLSKTWIKASVNCAFTANVVDAHDLALDYCAPLLARLGVVAQVRMKSAYNALLQASYANYCLGNWTQAAQQAEEAVRYADGNEADVAGAKVFWGAALARSGQTQEVLSAMSKLVANAAVPVRAEGVMALCLILSGNMREGIAYADAALGGDAPYFCGGREWRMRAELHELLATAHAALGDHVTASIHSQLSLGWSDGTRIDFAHSGGDTRAEGDGDGRGDRGGSGSAAGG